jgi:predicted ATPase
MITRIEAKQYRCLQSVRQELGQFHVLVGPNGSGKSAFLDTFAFVGTFLSDGLIEAVRDRTENFHDLVWGREGGCFELAVEALGPRMGGGWRMPLRYELTIAIHAPSDALVVTKERVTAHPNEPGSRVLVDRTRESVRISPEAPGEPESLSGLGDGRSALFHLDKPRFPSTFWLRELLGTGVQTIALENASLRKPSAPAKGNQKIVDGSNLARLVFQLQSESKERFDWWVAHVQTALPDLDSIRTILRPEDKHRYLMLRYKNGIEAPSWVVSDGTLRLLALTILAYLPDFKGIYLIEEPENGVHPTALETIYQSLSSVYDGQVLVTSHSPILLNLPKLEELLCFQKTAGGTEIVRGDKHPALRDWKREVSLSDLFASGVLG